MGVTRNSLPTPADTTYYDYSNVLYAQDYGAVGTDGTVDDTAAIQAAINAASPGQPVMLHNGIYKVSNQLDLKQGTVLVGSMAPRFAHYQTTNASLTGPAIGTVLRMASSFTGNAMLNATASSPPSYTTGAIRISNLVIDCRGNTASSADGILCTGRLYDPRIQNVTIQDPGGHGVHFADDGGGEKTLAAQLVSVMVHGAGVGPSASSNGFDLFFADSYVTDCYTLNCRGSGFVIRRMANTSILGCRSEWNGIHGYHFTNEIAGGGTMTGCVTDRNNNNGVYIDGTAGQGSLVISGCAFRRDGRNGTVGSGTDGSGGGSYAAVALNGCTQPVVLSGFTISPGVNDDSSGTNSPQYGISATGSRSLAYSNGHIHAATAAFNDGGTNTAIQRGFNVTTATGTLGSPTYDYTQLVSLSGASKVGFNKTPTIPLDSTSATTGASQARWVYTGATGNTSPNIYCEGVEATGFAYGAKVTGDTIDRYRVEHSGKIAWGPGGSTARDTTLERSAAGVVKASNALTLAGLTGATTASRYVGGTTTAAPTSGTFAVGDFVIAQDGKIWVCTTAGTPGSWFHAGSGSMSLINVKDYGAKGDNSTDDTVALAAAVAACPAGGMVFFPPGQYRTKNTIVVPPRVSIVGSSATHWPQYSDDSQMSCCIKPYFGSFTGTALIQFKDAADGAYSTTYSSAQILRNISLYGVNAVGPVSANVDGIYSEGPVIDVILDHVTINDFSGHGLHTKNKTGTNTQPKGWQLLHCSVQSSNGRGYYHEDASSGSSFAITDTTYIGCWAGANSNDGWKIDSTISMDLVGCRSEFNTGYGYYLLGSSRARMLDCDTDRNTKDGYRIESQGNGSRMVTLVGCVANRDGANDDVTAAGYAGFNIVGTNVSPHNPVTMSGCTVNVNHNDAGAGIYSPDYGLQVAYAPQISVSNCLLTGTVGAMNDTQKQVSYDQTTRFNVASPSTGTVTLEAANTQRMIGDAGTNRDIEYWTATSGKRWALRCSSTTEAGSNAGSNFSLARYSDAGSVIDTPFTVNRASGLVSLSQDMTVGNNGSAKIGPVILPGDFSYKAWTYDPMLGLNATAPTSGTVYIGRLQFRGADTVTGLAYGVVSVSGIALTSGQCFVALYDSTGTRVAVSADISGSFGSVGEVTFNFTGTYTVAAGFYWAALLLVGSTIPTIARANGQISNFGSAQVTAANRRFGLAATAQTSAPSSFTPSSITATTNGNYWVGAV